MFFLTTMYKLKGAHMVLFLYKKIIQNLIITHNRIIHIIWNKDQNHYYYNIFSDKCSYQLPKSNDNK